MNLFAQQRSGQCKVFRDTHGTLIIFTVLILLFGLIVLAVFAHYFRFWIQSKTTRAGIGILDLVGMTFRKVSPGVIVRSKIMAVQAGIGDRDGVTSKGLEAHSWRAAMCRWSSAR